MGPPTLAPHSQKYIAELVFPGNLRQAFVEGKTVHWVQGKEGLRELVGRELSKSLDSSQDLFFLFRFISFESIERWAHDVRDLKEQVYGEEYARDRPTGPDDFSITLHWPNCSKEWKEFTYHALELQADLEDLILEALADGRLLVGEAKNNGDRYLPPSFVSSFEVGQFGEHHYFALSKDLPESIQKREEPIDSRRKRATNWVEELNKHYSDTPRKFTATDAQIVMQDKFDLSPNAAGDAWNAANFSKAGFRNIKRKLKISIEEIREFGKI